MKSLSPGDNVANRGVVEMKIERIVQAEILGSKLFGERFNLGV